MSVYEQLKDDLGYLQIGAASERFAVLAEDAQTEGWSHVEYLARMVGEQAPPPGIGGSPLGSATPGSPDRRTIDDFDF